MAAVLSRLQRSRAMASAVRPHAWHGRRLLRPQHEASRPQLGMLGIHSKSLSPFKEGVSCYYAQSMLYRPFAKNGAMYDPMRKEKHFQLLFHHAAKVLRTQNYQEKHCTLTLN